MTGRLFEPHALPVLHKLAQERNFNMVLTDKFTKRGYLRRNLMLTTSKYIMHGCSSRCAFCNRPFCSRDGYVEFWRASNDKHFCSEFCADDAEEARFRLQHAAFSGPTATHSAQV